MSGFEEGDRVTLTADVWSYSKDEDGVIAGVNPDHENMYLVRMDRSSPRGHKGNPKFGVTCDTGHGVWVYDKKLESIGESMSRKSPRNFRNGDIIQVENDTVFIKFGESYYNISAGGQMKAHKYLPSNTTKRVINNISGLGKFFLMDEEELKETVKGEEKGEGEDARITATEIGAGSNGSIWWGSSTGGTTSALTIDELEQTIKKMRDYTIDTKSGGL